MTLMICMVSLSLAHAHIKSRTNARLLDFQLDKLGITRAASEKEIKRAFLLKAKQYHPDVNKDKDAPKKFA